MTVLRLRDGLPFVSLRLQHCGKTLEFHNALIDTGSAGTLLATDHALAMGLDYQPQDILYHIHGVGGSEVVYEKRIDYLSINDSSIYDFSVQIGAMDYGFALDAIIGMDFLTRMNAVINLAQLQITAEINLI